MEVIDLDTWLDDYATRRYGAESESANQAWDILKETVYKASLNGLGQGAPESVVNARPNLTIGAASTWGNAVISYEKGDLEEAAALLLADYDKLKDSAGYSTIWQMFCSRYFPTALRNIKKVCLQRSAQKIWTALKHIRKNSCQ